MGNVNDSNIITFRLNALEEMVIKYNSDLISKVDLIIERQQEQDTLSAVADARREQMEKDIRRNADSIRYIENSITKIKITMAEKLGPGAIAGGLVAALIELVRFSTGG